MTRSSSLYGVHLLLLLYCCIVVVLLLQPFQDFHCLLSSKWCQFSIRAFFGYSRLFRLISTCPKRFKPVYIDSNKYILAQTYQIGSKLSKLVKASLNWPKPLKIDKKIFCLIQTISSWFRLVKTCSNLSKFVQTCFKLLKIG